MPYTEVKERKGRKYYYRVISVRNGKNVGKKRKYLGVNLNRAILSKEEEKADKYFTKRETNIALERLKQKILPILKDKKIRKAGIFGSYVRGEQKKESDVDILIEPPKHIGLGFIGIALDLEEALGKRVDLVTYKSINKYLKKRILNEEIRII